ncbi:MAG: hypothetical protein K2X81_27285, partial [Candidatus Obscuribacterales bacterium]|nr:hypothetical protein [Candidatus Obscuribacterales bacterium]
ANLPALPFLRSLNIENCPVDGSFLKDLQAPSLLFVRLRSAKLNEQCLANLKQFPKLTNLEVQSHALSLGKAELLAIADLPSLTKLNMLAGSIDVNALPALARAKKLKEIRCESSDCDPNFLQGIIDCKKLEYVFLGARPSDDALRLFKKKHPRCEISYLGAWQDKKGRK